jgi:hypothetical protein
LGVGSINVFGNSDIYQDEIILYSGTGWIFEEGMERDTNVAYTSGDLISCEVDLIANKAAWFKNGVKIDSTDIP